MGVGRVVREGLSEKYPLGRDLKKIRDWGVNSKYKGPGAGEGLACIQGTQGS